MKTTIETLPASKLVKHQIKTYGPKSYQEHGETLHITATVRYGDRCGNGYNSFGITADIRGPRGFWAGGCCHEEVVKHFPELAPFIKWHLCGSDGPMHYVANTLYHAGNRDHNGLLKGEFRQHLSRGKHQAGGTTGEGKDRELDYARSSAIWPDATDEQLCQEPEQLKAALIERLPALMAEFKAAVESLGFIY